jgi:hypothetical protein
MPMTIQSVQGRMSSSKGMNRSELVHSAHASPVEAAGSDLQHLDLTVKHTIVRITDDARQRRRSTIWRTGGPGA